ncbi:Clan CA, family C1, cathepsin L-like cysteine peptidase [Trichomonas vaginalis G3]|uniref:Clan CA, family C1, cathepsin L-like cysteine peptidase n=1 Tax=Trichomonas vaginalis (strain ATCC PRA-98 / G3) TaxID=412133 RepID=A2FGI5_TRIV3|nr:cysteine-type peptidase protein [Trichomonas vaginalis G3]EAX95999.1 Clan CA, family C1, cathepsin L-like cysteine peptidase [Trichomonas vaginalis G3]KAI5537670.1 cysteine-type peptidase protein [Trichomonas vaginalis G3]|eukprot:XP_001308929.1 Clan CA, family C1, cathepsin L-like cysteine peptidase [Trichomonas vaginalis G3]
MVLIKTVLKSNFNGLVAAAIDASRSTFQLYTSGIYYDQHCSTILDHAIGVVGYGSEGGNNYWIVRNSWGSSWGEQGYIRMAKDKNNMCGISNDVNVPYIK